jgi:uncharacterized membrane protein
VSGVCGAALRVGAVAGFLLFIGLVLTYFANDPRQPPAVPVLLLGCVFGAVTVGAVAVAIATAPF